MKESECLSYRSTGYYSKLICDYLDQSESLRPFYNHFPSLENFKAQIAEKEKFDGAKRQSLVSSLQKQYSRLKEPLPENSPIDINIRSLAKENTFTVTTGHQLNILTGPLYFIYKIVTTLNLARELQEAYPHYHFVPVFWMASEDHDFEEINHINFYGGKLSWNNNLKGAVGHMPTFGMGKVLDELEEHLGPGDQAAELLKIFRGAYHDHQNMADATRYIAHKLFGHLGLVVLDGDDAGLKAQMKAYFEDDLIKHSANARVEESSQKLAQQYFNQVYPREINLFYLKPGLRERIVRKGERWLVLNTEISFNEQDLKKELSDHPERFSPNVVLRPLYQEVVLPNLAYIGGGGELAYWLQLKSTFNHFELPFPSLVLRNSVLWINPKWQNRMADLNLKPADFFQALDQLKDQLARRSAPVDPDLKKYEAQLQEMFQELEEIANLTEESMLGAVNAQKQKQLRGLANLKKKLLRAEKRKHTIDMEKAERIYHALFPAGGLQERHDNLSPYYAAYGPEFIATLLRKLNPLDFRFAIIHA